MFITQFLNEVKASINSIKEVLEEQEKQLLMAGNGIDILFEVPIESRDEQYFHIVNKLIDINDHYLHRYKDNVILYTKLVTVLNTLESKSD